MENIVAKKKLSAAEASESVYMRERVKYKFSITHSRATIRLVFTSSTKKSQTLSGNF